MSTNYEPVVLGPELAGALLTPEEFDAVQDSDELFVYELIQGVLVVTPPPPEEERGSNQLLVGCSSRTRRTIRRGRRWITLFQSTSCG